MSDGLADGIRQIGAASGCGARIDASALPTEPGAAAWWQALGVDPVMAAVTGGEDYELLFAVPKKGGRLRHVRRHVANPVMTRIGVWLKDPSELVVERDGRDEALPPGYEHFENRP